MIAIYLLIANLAGFITPFILMRLIRYRRQRLINNIVNDIIAGGNMTFETQQMMNRIKHHAEKHGLHVNIRNDNFISIYNTTDEIELFRSTRFLDNGLDYVIKINNKTLDQQFFDNDPNVQTLDVLAKIALKRYHELIEKKIR